MKPKKQSAGILLYRIDQNRLEIFLVHPGGPFWTKKDGGAWSIPKGEFASDEDPLEAAKREFKEETGKQLSGVFLSLSFINSFWSMSSVGWYLPFTLARR